MPDLDNVVPANLSHSDLIRERDLLRRDDATGFLNTRENDRLRELTAELMRRLKKA